MTSKVETAQARQETYLDCLALFSRLYWGPDDALCQELAGQETADTLGGLAPWLEAEDSDTLRDLLAYLQSFSSAEELCAPVSEAYVRLFVSHPGGLAAPLYHSCYVGEGLVMGPPAGAMAQRLEEAGLALEDKPGEPPDHLAVELEYLIYLLEEGGRGRPELMEQAQEMAGRFMLPWLREFSERQQSESGCPLYPMAARLLVAVLEGLAEEAS
jgi:TorA maturation chaperone TorD